MSQIEALPVTSKELRQETGKDIELGTLLKALREGNTIADGCIMYGQRVCIPRKFRKNALEELHAGHLGIVKMKAIARSFVYWKNIDKGIVDFARPIFEHTFFLIVDAHSKWLEVYPMKVTTTKKTIECLRDSFEKFGLPRVLVSDNGSQFKSYEFQRFMHKNGVKHKTIAPFKPFSNGQAGRYVATLKQSLSINTKDKLRRDNFEFRDREFDVGDREAVRVYRAANTRWKFGTIVNQDGVLHYIIDVQGTLQRFEKTTNIQHAETAEDISKDLNKELGSSSVQGVPSTDVAVSDLSQSSAKETD
ncbi:uncharacterized protein K02A2.6 [Trichonephila clavipes]|nr:uncharacterized protein K02A2.6 [Trichonephila clavipes]